MDTTFYLEALLADIITSVSEYPHVNYRKYLTETNLQKQPLFPALTISVHTYISSSHSFYFRLVEQGF